MSLLGKLIHQVSSSIAGGALSNDHAYATHIHSLGTNPEAVFAQLVSVATAGSLQGAPALMAVGGNASALTSGIAYGSAASCPVVAFTLTAIKFHSFIK